MASTNLNAITPEKLAGIGKIALAMVIFGIFLGIFSVDMEFYYIAAAIIGLLFVVVLVWNFDITLIIYVLMSFVPWGRTPDIAQGGSGFGKGLYVSEIMLSFLLIVWLGKYFTGNLPKNRIKSGFYIPIALYLVFTILNVITSFIFWDPRVDKMYQNIFANYAEIALHILSAAALAIMATAISTMRTAIWAAAMLMIAGVYNSLNNLCGFIVPFGAVWYSLLTFLPTCFCLIVTFNSAFNKYLRIVCAIMLITFITQVVFINISWVSGYMGLLCALAVTALIYSRKLFFAGLMVFIVACVICWPTIQHDIIHASDEEGDFQRFGMFTGAIKLANLFPMGVGLGNYRSYIIEYSGRLGIPGFASAHGTYAQHLAEMGWLGTILFLSIGLSGFTWLIKQYKELPPGFAKWFILAVIGQITGIFVSASIGDYIFPAYHNGGLVTFSTTVQSWLIWGTAIALVRLSKAEAK